uniref:Leucine-rich repeat-containing N-terminal plant-type domain-containing protein n=1 Tax=Fagus sylvatica TaxID=28930 RepID=A0A2N9J7M6_FAGSY
MTLIMGGRSLKLLYAIFTLLVHLKLALGFFSGAGEDAKKNCCNWEGVHCSYQTGHVVKLNLQAWKNPTLRGKINPSLIELHHLSYLDLSGNDFNQSQFPKFISSLSDLQFLGLYDANLFGPIPSQLGNLSQLQFLDLGSNYFQLVENIEWISHLVSIKHLGLNSVNLSVVNDWLNVVSHLPKLSKLLLRNCDLPLITLSSLSHINSSKSLTYLDLSSNPRITSSMFPWLFNSSTNLAYLDLSSNQLQGSIPNGFDNMNSLEQLYLFDNQLEGNIPKSFGDICTLRTLDLWKNNLDGQCILQDCRRCFTARGYHNFTKGDLGPLILHAFLPLTDSCYCASFG